MTNNVIFYGMKGNAVVPVVFFASAASLLGVINSWF